MRCASCRWRRERDDENHRLDARLRRARRGCARGVRPPPRPGAGGGSPSCPRRARAQAPGCTAGAGCAGRPRGPIPRQTRRHALQHRARARRRLPRARPVEQPRGSDAHPRRPGAAEPPPPAAAALARQGRADASAKTAPKALRLPYSRENLALLSKDEAKPEAQPVAAAPAATVARVEPKPEATPAPAPAERDPDAIEFVWPARGKLLAPFSEPNSKGVDIAGRVGDPVIAAAPGRVMYTGTGIRGYGKLIVIKHDNGFNSVYAHNREILVKEGQSVARGQRIAEPRGTESGAPQLPLRI